MQPDENERRTLTLNEQPRTVPVIRDEYVITIGPQGHVMCCDPVTGDLKWGIDMQKQFKTD